MELGRRQFVAGGLALAGTALLAGCTAGGTTGSGGSRKATITVMWASAELSKAQIAQFEKANPNIKVTFIEYDDTRLNAMMTAGNPPDVVRGGPSSNLFARGLASPLDSYIAQSKVIRKSDIMPANDVWKWNGKVRGSGKTYGVIKDFSPDSQIWQNTALFDKAGVAPLSTTAPASWDDVLDVAKKLKAAGVQYPFGIEWAWGIANEVGAMVEQQGGSVFNSSLTKADYSSPEAIRALQWLVDFGKAGVGPTSLSPLAAGQDAPAYTSGTMAMTMDGYWFGGNLQANNAADVAKTSQLVPAPSYGKRISMLFGGIGAWIPTASKQKDAAWQFVEWYCGGQPAVDRAKTGWGLPILRSNWKYLPRDSAYQKQAYDCALAEMKYIAPPPDSPYVTFAQVNQVIDAEIQKVLQGKQTTDQAGASITSQVNTFAAQGKAQLG